MPRIPRSCSTRPDLVDIARTSIEEAALIGEYFDDLERAIERFDVDMMCAAFWAVDELRRAGHTELRRQHARRRLQLVSR